MADNIKYRFIQNVGDYFPSGYFSDDFLEKVQKCAGVSSDEMKQLNAPFVALQKVYDDYKNFIVNMHPRTEDAIKHTHDFNTRLLKILGYTTDNAYAEPIVLKDEGDPVEIIPVRHILRHGSQTRMLVMEMQHLISTDEKEPAGLFEQQYESVPERTSNQQKYYAGQWRFVFNLDKEKYKISPSIINKAITEIFLLPEERRPHFILMMAGNKVFLLDKDKWAKGAYLEFSLDELFAQAHLTAFRNYYALFHILCSKQTLAADGEIDLMDSIIEESYKNAYEVTKDLKEGVILAVETLANEALYWWNHQNSLPVPDYTDDTFEQQVKDDCLTIIYRLLFLFYAESREELEILPLNDETYRRGYSLEALRDLEMVRLNSEESRNGYFFDSSMRHLFSLLSDGHTGHSKTGAGKGFNVRPIDSPLFNDKNLHHLASVRLRNVKWQEIIRALSLSKKKNYCGRISYANLGVNQLGSVYESLLAFRGFYAEEDYIEVHKAGAPEDGTFLVPYSRMGDFTMNEVLCDPETGDPQILPQGTFVYRLNGRDRQKSASYYTPEVLTRSTVKYTLKSIIDEVAAGKRPATDLLELKILEPAMGAAAFQNEVINQVAEAYLTYQQQQLYEKGRQNWRISPDHYRDELQKVKAYIATHNVYGVDLNPTAIELGKLSLWLNVIHKDMETPFFANRLTVGNAVIGAWLKVYSRDEVYGIKPTKGRVLLANKWWEKSPHKVKFFSNRVNRSAGEVYHFLLPDPAMLGVRNIAEQKKENKTADAEMAKIVKGWTACIDDTAFRKLQTLSAKIDILLKEYFTNQLAIDQYTNNRREVWDGSNHTETSNIWQDKEQAETYANKQELFDTRYRHDNAYFRLKMVMDYWCALWFWEYDDAASLPKRDEYWADIEKMLNVSDEQLDARTLRALEKGDGLQGDEKSDVIKRSKEELLTEVKGDYRTIFDDSVRFAIVKRLSDRYRFFHPMLEFIEVFWLRDGFDIICGNPPWIKMQFKEEDVISEKYPEIVIRDLSDKEYASIKQQFLVNSDTKHLFVSEETETECSKKFLNSCCNYPLLIGQQTNLYKCVLENAMDMISPKGYLGLLCQKGILDDANGQAMRRVIYKSLLFHFHYQNKLNLFVGPGSDLSFECHIMSTPKENIDFLSIHNLYAPQTIDACFCHSGAGEFIGMKDENGKWNTAGHKSRIIHYTNHEIETLSNVFEDGTTKDCAKLVSINNKEILGIIEKLEDYPTHIRERQHLTTVCFDEKNSVADFTIKPEVRYPDIEKYEMIYKAPHFFVGNPLYKTPRTKCITKFDYDDLDLSQISEDYIERTNFIPLLSLSEIKDSVKGFITGNSQESYLDYYKVAFRRRVNLTSERSLICAVLPRKTAHINAVISTAFRSGYDCVDMAALCSSIILDFYIKTIGASDIYPNRIDAFPLGIPAKYQSAMYSRTLLLNCLTTHYSDLWSDCWRDTYAAETWSKADERLKPFSGLTADWQWSTPLRNYFERRQALVEIDVLAAMALGLSLQDLEMIYTIQFPVLQQNENDTWYDACGNIVFTCSKGLTGVGLDRKKNTKTGVLGWEDIRGEQLDENTYAGTAPTHTHTIDPQKSELYGGQQVTYYAPYTRCNRIDDYRTAWAHFEKIFNNN